MGKQGRRKQRQRRKQQQQPIGDGDSNHHAVSSSSSAVHKLRHADPKIRHAALIALQATAFQQQAPPYHHSLNQRVALPVLQAVREQVLDNDLECSAVAAECLVLYLQQQQQQQQQTAEDANELTSEQQQQQHREEATASWATVLLGRLEQCYNYFQETKATAVPAGQEPSNASKKRTKSWLAVATPCLYALCLLIETNGSALEQILLQRQTFCRILFGLLEVLDDDDDQAAMYAARSLHSALDENLELADTVVMSYLNHNAWKRWLELGRDKAAMVQLHLVGGLVNLYQLVDEQGAEHKVLEDMIMTHGIFSFEQRNEITFKPHTSDGMLTYSLRRKEFLLPETLTQILSEFQAAQDLFESQQQDAKLEEEIVRKVKDRKEPAREIAKRQKKQNEEEELVRKKRLEGQLDVEMEDAEAEEKAPSSRGKFTNREKDGELAMDEVLSKWNDLVQPLQLTFEILANLYTSWIPYDDDMMDESNITETHNRLKQHLEKEHIGLDLFCLIKELRQANVAFPKDVPMWSSIGETISKACACLSNCVLSGSYDKEDDYGEPWRTFCDFLREKCEFDSSDDVPEEVLNGLMNTMEVFLKRRPNLATMSESNTLHTLMSMRWGSESTRSTISQLSAAVADSGWNGSDLDVQRYATSLLDLLADSQTQPSIRLEILNAFMDWFGQDDFFPQLFDDMKVGQAIQQSLANFKGISLSPEEEETLQNASQFLEYKKKQPACGTPY